MMDKIGAYRMTSPQSNTGRFSSPSDIVTPRKHVKQAVQWVLFTFLIAWGLATLSRSSTLDWPTIGKYLTNGAIIDGLYLTLVLTGICLFISLMIGILLATAQSSNSPLLQMAVRGYIDLFRSIPPLLQLLVWFNLALFFPRIIIGIPLTSIEFSADTNTIVTPFMAAVIALSLNEAAYMAEIVRGGIQAVPPAQYDAATSLGMTKWERFRYVILPQATVTMLPALGNQAIALLKATSLVSVIGLGELLTNTQRIYNQNFNVLPLLMVASIWYLSITFLLNLLFTFCENYFSHDKIRPYPAEFILRSGAKFFSFVWRSQTLPSAVRRNK